MNGMDSSNRDVDNRMLYSCPRCGAHKWTCHDGDLFIRDRVRCQWCGYECARRDVSLDGHAV
jgi:DNA-directed RNA polymerase subunit RPC12/RpoP